MDQNLGFTTGSINFIMFSKLLQIISIFIIASWLLKLSGNKKYNYKLKFVYCALIKVFMICQQFINNEIQNKNLHKVRPSVLVKMH